MPGLPKPVVTFYWDLKTFVQFLSNYQNALSKILKVWSTKTCSYDKQKLTKKSKIRHKTRKQYNVYLILICYEHITVLYILLYIILHTLYILIIYMHTFTHTHMHTHNYKFQLKQKWRLSMAIAEMKRDTEQTMKLSSCTKLALRAS